MLKIKGLVFDLDGVITETASLHYLAWKTILAQKNINLTKAENTKVKGLPRLATLQAILKLKNKSSDFSIQELEIMAKNKNNYYLKLLDSHLKRGDWLENIDQLLQEAKAAKLKLAIASSSHNAPKILTKIGLIDYFDYIVNPQEVSKGKPDPEIFLKACAGLKLKPEETIGFEDALAGVAGLKAANIYTIAITHMEKGKWEMADQVYHHTRELKLATILRRKRCLSQK